MTQDMIPDKLHLTIGYDGTRGIATEHHHIGSVDQDYAAFIVCACNSHYAMLESLRKIEARCSIGCLDEWSIKAIAQIAKEAIAQAKENSNVE